MPTDRHPVNRSVLQVRHLPSEFSEAECVSFLKAHGAFNVTIRGRGQAFAHFNSELEARQAMGLLHQLQINSCYLLVTFARWNHNIPLLPPILPNSTTISETERIIGRVHAIAPHLGLNYILNPMVKYKYPPLTDSILANICATLRDNANFYTQVLHLMNKMNLQAPFRRRSDPSKIFQSVALKDVTTGMTSESASDLSEEETRTLRKRPLVIKERAHVPEKKIRVPKRNIPLSTLLPKEKPKQVSACFDLANPIRKLELPAISKIAAQKIETAALPVIETGFGYLKTESLPKFAPELPAKYIWPSAFTVIACMEKISQEDAIDHPAFRNYEAGSPCVRLYIKNLSKAVTEDDLFLLFGQFVPEDEAERAIFDIRLMKAGRMRGQAFVTFGSIGAAEKALAAVHRLILKGKPISVQFARLNT